jgi:hypothetical protein
VLDVTGELARVPCLTDQDDEQLTDSELAKRQLFPLEVMGLQEFVVTIDEEGLERP